MSKVKKRALCHLLQVELCAGTSLSMIGLLLQIKEGSLAICNRDLSEPSDLEELQKDYDSLPSSASKEQKAAPKRRLYSYLHETKTPPRKMLCKINAGSSSTARTLPQFDLDGGKLPDCTESEHEDESAAEITPADLDASYAKVPPLPRPFNSAATQQRQQQRRQQQQR